MLRTLGVRESLLDLLQHIGMCDVAIIADDFSPPSKEWWERGVEILKKIDPLHLQCRCTINSTEKPTDGADTLKGAPIFDVKKMKFLPESILLEAARIRSGERNADYGDAVENFRRIKEIANAITGLSLTEAQICKIMIAVKLARELHNHKRDNLVDLCGYAEILQLIEEYNNHLTISKQ